METVRVGVVGSGFMGRTYAEVLDKHARGAELVAVAVGRRAPDLASDYGIACEASIEALTARPDIDAVILATPEAIRLDQVRVAAAAGKHILSEKPLAPDVAQADQMIAACREAGVTLMVCQTARYRGTLWRAKQLVDEGRIGKVRQIRTYAMGTLQDYTEFVGLKPWIADPEGGGFIYDQAVHNFDFMRWLTGSEVVQVFAYVATQSDVPWPGMTMMAQIRYASGAMAQVNLCFELPGTDFPEHTTRFQIIGEKGLLDLDMVTNLRLGMNGTWEVLWEQPPIDFVNEPNSPIRLEAHAAMVQEFLDSLLQGRAPAIPGEDGRAAIETCEACMLSARIGQAVTLPLSRASIQ
jgi:predicted dehydrogenase